MEQKRQKALDMAERMKMEATKRIEEGLQLYIMHATCAVEFADLLAELLTSEPTSAPKAEPSQDAPIRVTVEYDGKKELFETNAAFLSFIDPKDGNPIVDFCTRNASTMQEFMIYIALMQACNKLGEENNFKKLYEQGLKEGLFQKKIDLTAQEGGDNA